MGHRQVARRVAGRIAAVRRSAARPRPACAVGAGALPPARKVPAVVKRRKEEDIAGVLEFAGMAAEDPAFVRQLQQHKERNGGKVRVGKGASGVRVMFSKDADMEAWRAWSREVRSAAAAK